MRIAAPLFAAAAALAAVPVNGQYLSKPNCTKKECTVTIIVPAGCGSGIKVSPEPIVVGEKDTVDINWVIATKGWTFDNHGIQVHWGEAAFKVKSGRPGDRTFVMGHKNEKRAVYKYDINLVRTLEEKDDKGKPKVEKCKLDPTVVNW
jgi:hypothetical protein